MHAINDVDDVSNVLSQVVRKRRNAVIVGDSVANLEEVARRLMQRLERGNVEGELRILARRKLKRRLRNLGC